MITQVLKETEEKMKKVIEATKREFATIRTGRARPSLVENIKVEYYGTLTPLNQMAQISAPEPRLLTIRPWDKTAISAIEKAIIASDLGLTPNTDGEVIRLNIPQLTEERRKELVKVVRKKAEEERIVIRNLRREANEQLKKLKEDGEISEDEMYRGLDDVQELTDKYIEKIDKLLEEKEAEIMEI
ncbi:ribosome recycling factor [Anoxybacter fermentans]|uniref:Ribosome-recycling factor n=1 Tax=Anoxybacter fermentans TaxID=1323375 RepID=A0A3S9SVS1_9FIRM|nr:ribosome recycling factor [Anoxybacter fermentans]AZR72374.1 ribosome recycling factor [Anoxybacter fermentans]